MFTMFSGTSQGLLEEFCNKVAAQLSEVSQDVDQLKGFQSQMDEWKHKLEGHILKHREVSGVMQSEIRDRQAKVQGISDDIQELETGLSQVASWSQLIQETITKASDDNEKEKKMAQAAQLLAECSGADQEGFLALAKKFMQEKKDSETSAAQASGTQAEVQVTEAQPNPADAKPQDPVSAEQLGATAKAQAEKPTAKAQAEKPTGSEFLGESCEKKLRTE